MNLSRKWLGEFVDVDANDKDFAEIMTMAGSKVETYARLDAEIKNVVVGKVLSMVRHENSDHMWVCQVDVGRGEPVQIVTGAQNVHEGDLVPAALHNSYLPGGVHITKGKLRGVASNGMLCSLKELNLTLNDFPYAIEDGIWILQEDCTVGQDINEVIGNDDTVVEFEITNNRPDCFSLIGLAREAAEALTQTRLKAFEELNRRISATLDFLNMPGVRLSLRHSRGPLASHGQDSIEFYIATNPGEPPKPLAKIASGGELSRITLAIKNALADRDAVPTVIYDEIDSGVSGKAAGKIGQVLRQSARSGHQILCITHTAQIAAMADCHMLIQKRVEGERAFTQVTPLGPEGRVDALAHLISGDQVTDLARANAREMLELAGRE